ncbi:hypothetical protein ACFL3Q_06420 [Planctomycetota bacterium]
MIIIFLRGSETLFEKKPNLRKGNNNVSIYIKGHYEEFYGFGRRKNKANQSQFTGEAESAQTIPIPMHDNRDEAATQGKLEKTKPIYSYFVCGISYVAF